VGTGAALSLGRAGDADVLLVHSTVDEMKFLNEGHGLVREPVMYNKFILVGPSNDPATVRHLSAPKALQRIAQVGSSFLSRGDDSGTHRRERLLWSETKTSPHWPLYLEAGSGMAATLRMAAELQAYTLTDEATWWRVANQSDLVPLITESENLHNPYGAIVVNTKVTGRPHGEASRFVKFLVSQTAQQLIRDYRFNGRPLFHPLQLSH